MGHPCTSSTMHVRCPTVTPQAHPAAAQHAGDDVLHGEQRLRHVALLQLVCVATHDSADSFWDTGNAWFNTQRNERDCVQIAMYFLPFCRSY
jgi:hypothetical protein